MGCNEATPVVDVMPKGFIVNATEAKNLKRDVSSEAEDKSRRPSPPAHITGKIGEINITINYSQPGVKERRIWGHLVPYGQVWRTGANEATWIEFDRDVLVNGQLIKKGKYGLFTIPGEGDWTLILNKVWDQWGAYEYREAEDVLRTPVTPVMVEESIERLEFGTTEKVNFSWEKLRFSFSVEPTD